jgi:hypothetical protein
MSAWVDTKKCDHTWYMREPGIMCTKCGLIWDNDTID